MPINCVRRFVHVDGFNDDTAYLESRPDGRVYLVRKDGSEVCAEKGRTLGWNLDGCLDFVRQGVWKEIKVE